MTAFLPAFPSLQVFRRVFPEAAALAVSPNADAADLDPVLKDVLSRDRYDWLTLACKPETILREPRELAARQRAAEPTRSPRPEKIEAPEPEGDAARELFRLVHAAIAYLTGFEMLASGD